MPRDYTANTSKYLGIILLIARLRYTRLMTIYSVSQLNNSVRHLLESEFTNLTVEGEISNFVCPASGHWYFSLKDDKAQIRCAQFRGANQRTSFKPKDGAQIQVRAKVSLYAPRGDYQLIVEQMEPLGDGALKLAFEKLKQSLNNEGLFAEQHKKTLPNIPQRIGVITSSTGAAIRDIMKVLHRRCPLIPIIIYPSLVQGTSAADSIANMISLANVRNECDVLIVGRGGGSLEDLWPFNEEIVARAIFASDIPIISAVGHEVDVSISDFVADVRAATPSAAAELVSPDQQQWQQRITHLNQRLRKNLLQILQHKQQNLNWLRKRLRHPGDKLQEQAQQLDYLWQSLVKAKQGLLKNKQQQLSNVSRALHTISPLATLDRGYSILLKEDVVVRSIKQAKSGEQLKIRVSDGSIDCKVL